MSNKWAKKDNYNQRKCSEKALNSHMNKKSKLKKIGKKKFKKLANKEI